MKTSLPSESLSSEKASFFPFLSSASRGRVWGRKAFVCRRNVWHSPASAETKATASAPNPNPGSRRNIFQWKIAESKSLFIFASRWAKKARLIALESIKHRREECPQLSPWKAFNHGRKFEFRLSVSLLLFFHQSRSRPSLVSITVRRKSSNSILASFRRPINGASAVLMNSLSDLRTYHDAARQSASLPVSKWWQIACHQRKKEKGSQWSFSEGWCCFVHKCNPLTFQFIRYRHVPADTRSQVSLLIGIFLRFLRSTNANKFSHFHLANARRFPSLADS